MDRGKSNRDRDTQWGRWGSKFTVVVVCCGVMELHRNRAWTSRRKNLMPGRETTMLTANWPWPGQGPRPWLTPIQSKFALVALSFSNTSPSQTQVTVAGTYNGRSMTLRMPTSILRQACVEITNSWRLSLFGLQDLLFSAISAVDQRRPTDAPNVSPDLRGFLIARKVIISVLTPGAGVMSHTRTESEPYTKLGL